MAKYVYVVYAESPRDGGFVRIFGHFQVEKLAWEAVEFVEWTGDYIGVEVRRTIAFR